MAKPINGATTGRSQIRCAIYTRKSSEEGLEQDFNSLDAQREACEAFIKSQKHEGWACLPQMYDDGGISGATVERPSLQRLLADIEARLVDTVVVYKVDRLTRSLSDFAKIVEVFDRHQVSFVSVTQQFNTTSSMGRLTLNMLLSFAQFEREVTGERIRDKIAASKAKGMWMGGLPPLGYDVRDRKLVVNEREAETVQRIYRRYALLGSVHDLKEELDSNGIVSKARLDKYSRQTGSRPLSRGALYLMLQNRIYRGEIVHKEKSFPGEHPAIIDESLSNEVQQKLRSNRVDRATGADAAEPSLLAGLVFDEGGEHLTPTHANKKGMRYRYYVSHRLVTGGRREAPDGRRVPASDLESLVEGRLVQFLSNQAEVFEAIESRVSDAREAKSIAGLAQELAKRWPKIAPHEKRAILLTLINRIAFTVDGLEILLMPGRLPAILRGETLPDRRRSRSPDDPTVALNIPVRLKRAGKENRLMIDAAAESRTTPDHSLQRLLAQAHRYNAMVMVAGDKTIAELAAEAGVGGSYFTRVFRLSFLAPDVVKAILRDRHPITLNAKRLANEIRIPVAWDQQRSLLTAD